MLPPIEIKVVGKAVIVPESSTILHVARALGIDTPALCFLHNLTPVNVCRVCVVELEGFRALVPACSRRLEAGMVVRTDSERVRFSRRLILEFLASSVDVSTAPAFQEYAERYAARPEPFGSSVATVRQPPKIDNVQSRGFHQKPKQSSMGADVGGLGVSRKPHFLSLAIHK